MVSALTTSTPTAADVSQILQEDTVRHGSMIAKRSSVRTMELVWMTSTVTHVPVCQVTPERDVKQKQMNVPVTHVEMVQLAWII